MIFCNQSQFHVTRIRTIVHNSSAPKKEFKPELHLTHIIEMVCKKQNLTVQEITNQRRLRETVTGRQLVSYFARKYLPLVSAKSIGKTLGGRHYSTILNSALEANNLIDTDQKYRKLVQELEVELLRNWRVKR